VATTPGAGHVRRRRAGRRFRPPVSAAARPRDRTDGLTVRELANGSSPTIRNLWTLENCRSARQKQPTIWFQECHQFDTSAAVLLIDGQQLIPTGNLHSSINSSK
jgi:hypothetical protein